jgi:hypothetical protein
MPRRTVGYQRVPSFGTPAFGNAMPLKDDMRHVAFAQMLAHGQSGLATTNNDRVYFFNGHFAVLFQLSKIFADEREVCLPAYWSDRVVKIMFSWGNA